MKKTKKMLFALGAASLLLGVASCAGMPGIEFSQNENGDITLDLEKNIPYIGENGNWWINGEDLGVPATGSRGEAGEKGETGEKGEAGADGKDGKDGKDGVNGSDGRDGVDGADGEDGKTPYIGENGNWWIDDVDTGVVAGAVGATGADGRDGEDGKTPYIGENGNWFIDGTDTGVAAGAVGRDGADGKDGKDGVDGRDGVDGEDGKTPYIGDNGNWWIDGVDTGVVAGVEESYRGKSAYEIFMEQHPEYTGDEAQWMTDLLNGRFFDLSNFTVTFEDGMGNVYDALTINIISGQAIIKPVDPVRSGWIFTGWYDKNTGEKWSFTANVVLGNVTLVAHWVRSSELPTCYFQNVYANAYGVDFSLHHNEIAVPQNIAIFDGNTGEMIENTLDAQTIQFNGLLANHFYRLEATYTYDLNDGTGEQTRTTEYHFYTPGLNTPNFYFNEISSTKTKITFDYWENDYDNIGEIKSVELYKMGDTTPCASLEDLSVKEFTGLLANTNYTVKIVYEYDLNDGNEVVSRVYENNVTTGAYTIPTVSFGNKKVTQNQITGTIKVQDPDHIDTIESVRLYDGNNLVEELDPEDLSVAIESLNENTQYTLKIVHSYDLLDGTGEKTETLEVSCRTHPVYGLTETTILNTSAILEGDTVVIHAVVNNPSGSRFTKVKINGEYYSVNPASTATNIYVNFAAPESGDVEYTITELVAELDGEEFIFYTSESNHAAARIYNRLSVDTVSSAVYNEETETYEERDYFFPADDIYVKVKLNNPEEYEASSFKINGSIYSGESVTQLSAEEYMVKIRNGYSYDYYYDYGQVRYDVQSVTYGNSEITKIAQYSNKSAFITKLRSSEVIEISSAEDFANIGLNENNNWKYHKITDDLDLSTIGQWESRNFSGVLDGNEKTISNFSIVDTLENVRGDFGIFNRAEGSIKDLSLSDTVIMMTYDSVPSGYDSYASFVAYEMYGNIKNVKIDDTCSFSMEYRCEDSYMNIYFGGFVGRIYGRLDGCINSANISLSCNTTNSAYFSGGGLIGQNWSSEYQFIKNSAFTGNIVTRNPNPHGGMGNDIRALTSMERVAIDNSYSTGLINGKPFDSLSGNGASVMNCGNFAATNPNEVLDWTNKTYHFNTNGGNTIADVVAPCAGNLPTPKKDGCIFYGWYDNEELEGTPVTQYYSEEGGTLYAKWLVVENDYSALVSNTSDYNNEYQFTYGDDGKIYSPKASETYQTGNYINSYFRITADRDMIVYYDFTIEAKNFMTYAYLEKTKVNGNSYSEVGWGGYFNGKDSFTGSIELKAGESIAFRIQLGYLGEDHDTEGFESQLTINNLEVCYL